MATRNAVSSTPYESMYATPVSPTCPTMRIRSVLLMRIETRPGSQPVVVGTTPPRDEEKTRLDRDNADKWRRGSSS